MTVSRLTDCNLYASRVIKPTVLYPAFLCGPSASAIIREKPSAFQKWILPLLTLVGTIASMWLVVCDGWFRLCGLWAS